MGRKASNMWIHFAKTEADEKFKTPTARFKSCFKTMHTAVKNLATNHSNYSKTPRLLGQITKLFLPKPDSLDCLITDTLSRPKRKQLNNLLAHVVYDIATTFVFFRTSSLAEVLCDDLQDMEGDLKSCIG